MSTRFLLKLRTIDFSAATPREKIEEALRPYELHAAVSPEDDPILWATILHCRYPFQMEGSKVYLEYGRADFAVGEMIRNKGDRTAYMGETYHGHIASGSDIHITHRWNFDVPSRGSLICTRRAVDEELGFGWNILAVTRPSRGVDSAMAYFSQRRGAVTGSGFTEMWRRNGDGSWRPALGESKMVWIA